MTFAALSQSAVTDMVTLHKKNNKNVSLADPNALSGLLLADPLNSRIIWSA